MNRPAILAATLAASLLALPQGAAAHAHLKRAEPAAGSTVPPPKMLKLWFSEAIEPAFTTVELLDPAGKPVATGKAHRDAKDRKVFEASLPPLAPGRYKVLWHALSVDTHKTAGSFTFQVAP